MGVSALTPFLACAIVVRNLRVPDAFEETQLEDD